jgi:2,3-bisphosphoglycerate-independent phosphoglycerate mutase
MDDLLGDIVSRAGKTQLRAAETEKYPHVTFFFNGGRETPYAGEERLLVPSPKVATYDLQPEMSAIELTDKLIAHVESGAFDFIVLNYANPDMVGHTGSIPAAIAAVETVDTSLGRVRDAIAKMNGTLIVTADHGNADQMVDPQTGQPHTAHTTFPVPFIVSGAGNVALRDGGCLGDIAPTILKLLNIPQPAAMTGKSLVA